MTALQHVLLIEDNEIAQRIPAIILEDSGCQVDIASNGTQALKLAHEQQGTYDLVLLDIGLPDIDGFEVAKQLRDINHTKKAPIIGLTAHMDEGSDCKYITETLAKPFTAKMLDSILHKHFTS